jgi:protein SCO1/2
MSLFHHVRLPARRVVRLKRPTALVVALAFGAALALTACSGSGSSTPIKIDGSTSTSPFDGDQLSQPVTLSASAQSAVFASSAGGSTTLADLQQGTLMLLYFGYTHCPDVCPTTMADLGLALREVPTQIQDHTQVVFVTSDPVRDTAPVIKSWLANFDPDLPRPFVGLTASLTQTDQIATSVGVPLSPPVIEPDGTVSVEHGAQTLAFINGKASVLWLAGTTPGDYAHDITALAETGMS